jgi:prepilin-type N-terminal cleavage/methylation domain-containing protein
MVNMKFLNNRVLAGTAGLTLVELLVAVLITGILATASLSFFSGVNNESITQENVSEMQDLSRATLMEIKKDLRMAGFKLRNHVPYEIYGSTLGIYKRQVNPVDTIWYYLDEYTAGDYASLPDLPTGRKLYKLMKQSNSNVPELFSDLVVGIQYTVIDSANVSIKVTTQTPKKDMDWKLNNGYRTFSAEERVMLRNVGLE